MSRGSRLIKSPDPSDISAGEHLFSTVLCPTTYDVPLLISTLGGVGEVLWGVWVEDLL